MNRKAYLAWYLTLASFLFLDKAAGSEHIRRVTHDLCFKCYNCFNTFTSKHGFTLTLFIKLYFTTYVWSYHHSHALSATKLRDIKCFLTHLDCKWWSQNLPWKRKSALKIVNFWEFIKSIRGFLDSVWCSC